MPSLAEYFRSVEAVWPLWAGSLALLAALIWRAFRGEKGTGAFSPPRWDWLRALHSEEDGAAYSLAYVLTVPFFMLLVCLVIQATLILIVKMGTMYAGYASARSAVVWRSLERHGQPDLDRAREKARLAAVHALTPFASSSKLHEAGNRVGQASEGADDYVRAYHTVARGSGLSAYLRAKYLYADKAASVDFPDQPDANGDLPVTVRYRMPLIIPGLAPWFGKLSPWDHRFYTMEIVSKVTLPDEAPQSESGRLGIDYGPP
jgi:hypothetical protein